MSSRSRFERKRNSSFYLNHHPNPRLSKRDTPGHKQYFVSSDVGDGKMQWYGFHKEAAGGEDAEGAKKERLLAIFGGWTDQVTDLLRATREDDVLRRDIYDRPPIFKW